MKRILTVMTVFMAINLCMASENQNFAISNDDPGFKGTSLFGAGLYLGYWGYGFYGTRSLVVPPLNVYYELGVHEYITVGPFVGFGRWDYRYVNYNYSWSFYHLGARGSFHLTTLINELLGNEIDAEKIDLYLTVMSGLEIRNYSSTYYSDLYDNSYRIFIGPSAGFRYYLSNNFALYVEGGRGALGALNFGVSVKF